MQRSTSNPKSPQPVFKSLAVALEKTLDRHGAAPRGDDHRTWADQMRQIDQLEDPERWDGMA